MLVDNIIEVFGVKQNQYLCLVDWHTKDVMAFGQCQEIQPKFGNCTIADVMRVYDIIFLEIIA